LATLEEVKALIENEAKKIPDESLYYLCRAHGLKRLKIYSLAFKILKTTLACCNLGFPYVTARMMAFALNIKVTKSDIWKALHLLGDYHILFRKRIEGRSQWIIHPSFASKLKKAGILHK